MTSGRKRTLTFAAATIGVMVLWVWTLTWEPSDSGRTLSAWLLDFESGTPDSQQQAAEAIRRIGPRAVPFLSATISKEVLNRRDSLGLFERLRVEALIALRERFPCCSSTNVPAYPGPTALAALNLLGPIGTNALPVLKELVEKKEPHALLLAANMGPVGLELISSALTNEFKVIRLEAIVCQAMIRAQSEILYPSPADPVGLEAFNMRRCALNNMILKAYFLEQSGIDPSNLTLPVPIPPVMSPISQRH